MHDKRVQNKLFTLEHVLPLCVESRGSGGRWKEKLCWSQLISFKTPTELSTHWDQLSFTVLCMNNCCLILWKLCFNCLALLLGINGRALPVTLPLLLLTFHVANDQILYIFECKATVGPLRGVLRLLNSPQNCWRQMRGRKPKSATRHHQLSVSSQKKWRGNYSCKTL